MNVTVGRKEVSLRKKALSRARVKVQWNKVLGYRYGIPKSVLGNE